MNTNTWISYKHSGDNLRGRPNVMKYSGAHALDCTVEDLNITCKYEPTKIFITLNQNSTFV